MFKSIVMAITIFTATGCSNKIPYTTLDQNKCWGELKVGTSVKGSALLYYFPNYGTFITNKKCPDKSIRISLSDHGRKELKRKFGNSKKNQNIFGISLIVNIDGLVISRIKGHALVKINKFSSSDKIDYISDNYP